MMKQKDPSERVRAKEKDHCDSRGTSSNHNKDRTANNTMKQHSESVSDPSRHHSRQSDKTQLKQMSEEVFLRARSTFSNISDVWRPRIAGASRAKDKTNGHDRSAAFDMPKHFRSQDDTSLAKGRSKLKSMSRQFSADPLGSKVVSDTELNASAAAAGPFARVKVLEVEDVLAIQRPRKKLSFREPEIIGGNRSYNETLPRRKTPCIVRSSSLDGLDLEQRLELESQAMRVVRTVGQAFEVCHKLVGAETASPQPQEAELSEADQSFTEEQRGQHDNSPEPNDKDREDLLVTPDELAKPNKVIQRKDNRPKKLELPTAQPPSSLRRSPSKCDQSITPTPMQMQDKTLAIAAQHELQLLREKLEQQTQQTQHAMSQLLLLRDQLAAETQARLEAQTRTQQLLAHNRELLDHIAALVNHLQDMERNEQHAPCTSTPPRSPGLILPQSAAITPTSPMPSYTSLVDGSSPNSAQLLDQLRPSSAMQQNANNNANNIFSYPLVNNLNALLAHQHHQQQSQADDGPFIRPLSQAGALTAVDSDGRVRVIVPVGNDMNQHNQTMVTLKVTDEGGHSVPTNNNAGLSMQTLPTLDRRAWSRHSTK